MPGAAALLIDQADLQRYINAVLNGDQASAVKLSMHYCISGSEGCIYWARIGAENGSMDSMFDLGTLLVGENESQSLRRGLFWLKRVLELKGTEFHAYDILVPTINRAEAKLDAIEDADENVEMDDKNAQ